MTTWTVKTYHKKSCEQHEFFVQRDGKGRIISTEGFRWCEYTVETSDGEFPKFEFREVPGGNGAKDSLDLFSCGGDNIVGSELIDMFDGGCWGNVEIDGIDDEEELERLMDFIDEEGGLIDAYNSGIIDPTKVVRSALENAAAAAVTLLMTECVIHNKPSDKKADAGMDMSMMGM